MRARNGEAARQVLAAAGYPAESLADGRLALDQAAALDRPDEIATLLVQGGNAPTELVVDEEQLEDYFLRLVGANGQEEKSIIR